MASRADRAINMALRVTGLSEVERDFKKAGAAGEASFKQVEKAANGADRAMSEYTARLKRVANQARTDFSTNRDVQAARLQDPAGYRPALNNYVLTAVNTEKERIAAGLPDLTQKLDDVGEAASRTGVRATAMGAAAGLAFTGMVFGVRASIDAFLEHENVLDSFEAKLSLAGNQSDATAKQIEGMARAVVETSNQTLEATLKASTMLATIPGMTAETMQAALQSTAAFADKIGEELPDVLEARTMPVLRALADKDVTALREALQDLDGDTGKTILTLAEAGDTAGAQAALFAKLSEAAGDGPNGLATSTSKASRSWQEFKSYMGDQFAAPMAAALDLISGALDRLRGKADAAGVSVLTMLNRMNAAQQGAAFDALRSRGIFMPVADLLLGGNIPSAPPIAPLPKVPKPRQGRGGGGKSDAEREQEQLDRAAKTAREAADRIREANDKVIEDYRRRAEEAAAKIGLEGAALQALERHYEVEAAVRRINTELIDKEVEARRAEAAAKKETFDEPAARAAATAAVAEQSRQVRDLAESYADAAEDIEYFNQRQAQAKAILEDLETPLDRLEKLVDQAIESLHRGDITADQFNRRMDQLAEGFADAAYGANKAAQAWRGFGGDVGRAFSDIILNGGDALDILQEFIRLPLERLLYQNVEMPIANLIDGLTGNNQDKNIAEARAGLPNAFLSDVSVEGAATGSAIALNEVATSASMAATALDTIGVREAAMDDFAMKTGTAASQLDNLTPAAARFGSMLDSLIGGGGGSGFGSLLGSLAGALIPGSGITKAGLAAIAPDVSATIAANPGLFASGTDRLPIGMPFEVGENGRERMTYLGGDRLRVDSNQSVRRAARENGGTTVIQNNIRIPERADPRRTASSVNRGTQRALALASRKGLA